MAYGSGCWSQTAVKHVAIAYDEAELQEHTKRSSFAHDEYFSRLSNQRLGHTLLTAFSLASTQVLLKECAPNRRSRLQSSPPSGGFARV